MSKRTLATYMFFSGMAILIFGGAPWSAIADIAGAALVIGAFALQGTRSL